MTRTARRLEYTVDEQGLVYTRGAYSEISEQEWARGVDLSAPRYRPYDAVVRALSHGRIVQLPCWTKRQAMGIRTTLRKRARVANLEIEEKVVLVSESPEEWAVLARTLPV